MKCQFCEGDLTPQTTFTLVWKKTKEMLNFCEVCAGDMARFHTRTKEDLHSEFPKFDGTKYRVKPSTYQHAGVITGLHFASGSYITASSPIVSFNNQVLKFMSGQDTIVTNNVGLIKYKHDLTDKIFNSLKYAQQELSRVQKEHKKSLPYGLTTACPSKIVPIGKGKFKIV